MGIAMASLAHFWQLDDEKVANINIEPATDIKPASYDTINASNRKDWPIGFQKADQFNDYIKML